MWFFYCHPPCFEAGSLTVPGAHQLTRLAGWLNAHQGSTCLHIPCTEQTDVSHHTQNSQGCWRSKLVFVGLCIYSRRFSDGIIPQTLLRDFCRERLENFAEPKIYCLCPTFCQYAAIHLHMSACWPILTWQGKSYSLKVNPSDMSFISTYYVFSKCNITFDHNFFIWSLERWYHD